MGVKTSLAAAALAATHTSAAFKSGRNASVLVTQAATQINDVVKTIQEVVKDMQVGNPSDPNIAAFNTLITNLS